MKVVGDDENLTHQGLKSPLEMCVYVFVLPCLAYQTLEQIAAIATRSNHLVMIGQRDCLSSF